ncbi:MAG: WG repeat-containing protein [Aliishimia sp.]
MQLFPFEQPGFPRRLGFINEDGDVVVEQIYAWSPYSQFNAAGYAVVQTEDLGEKLVIDTKGKVRLEISPDYFFSMMTPPDSYGLFPIEHRPDHGDKTAYEMEGRDWAYKGRRSDFAMTLAGDIAFEEKVSAFSHGAYGVKRALDGQKKPKFGIVDMKGSPRTDFDFDQLRWSQRDPYVCVGRDGLFGVIDHFGNEVIPIVHPTGRVPSYHGVTDGVAIYYDPSRDMCLTMDMQGRPLAAVPTTYWSPIYPKAVPTLSDGLMKITLRANDGGEGASVFMNAFGDTPMKDKSGKARMFAPEHRLGYFYHGLASIRINDLGGYIDKSGDVVIAPQYESAGDFRNGLAKVFFTTKDRQANQFAYINGYGEVVAQNY